MAISIRNESGRTRRASNPRSAPFRVCGVRVRYPFRYPFRYPYRLSKKQRGVSRSETIFPTYSNCARCEWPPTGKCFMGEGICRGMHRRTRRTTKDCGSYARNQAVYGVQAVRDTAPGPMRPDDL